MATIPEKLKQRGIYFVLIERGSKTPFQKKWQEKKMEFDDPELLQHLAIGGNYGVMGGGEKKLIVVDFDNLDVQEKVAQQMPETFTVLTGGKGMFHKYFFTNRTESYKIRDKEGKTLADVQCEGKQVIGAGSLHESGREYKVVDDKDIAFIDYGELKAMLDIYDQRQKTLTISESEEKFKNDYKQSFLNEISSAVSMPSVLRNFGVDTAKNPTNCIFHSSVGGKCLSFTDKLAHCFHCQEDTTGWNIFSFVKQAKGCNFKEALEWLADFGGMRDKLEESRREYSLSKNIAIALDKREQAKRIIKEAPCYYDKSRNWWLWNWTEYRWERVDETDILNCIVRNGNIDTIGSRERTEMLEALKQVSRENKPADIKKTWIQFQDEIYDIETGERFKAKPEWFVTNPLPYKIHPEKFMLTPTMDKIFEEWVGKEHLELLYEILAYCMLPDYPIHRIFCLVGAGMNGKSCFLRLLRKFIGEKNVCSTELDTLISSRFEVTRLHKKLVCQMGETNFNEISQTSKLKQLSGQDWIGYEYKGKDPFEDVNYAKIVIATNNLPTTTDKTIGFYRRWLIIDFPNQFGEQKEILDDIPEEEYQSLALKCAWKLQDLLKNRRFTAEGTLEERQAKYEAKSNFLGKFLNDFTTKEDVNGFITCNDFHKKFTSWCKENRHREMSETTLTALMKKEGIEQERKYFSWLYDGKGGTARSWMGICWKNEIKRT